MRSHAASNTHRGSSPVFLSKTPSPTCTITVGGTGSPNLPPLPHHPQTQIEQGALCSPHRNCERALLTISLRYVMSPRRQSPICSPMDPGVQVLDLAIEVCLVVLPCQPIHTRCGISLEGEECHPE